MQGTTTNSLEPYMLKLTPTLEQIERGDTLKDATITKITSQPSPGRLDDRIRKWFAQHGIVVKHRPAPYNGFYLLTDDEQAGQAEKDPPICQALGTGAQGGDGGGPHEIR